MILRMSLISIKLGNLRNQSVEENRIFISGEPGSNPVPIVGTRTLEKSKQSLIFRSRRRTYID